MISARLDKKLPKREKHKNYELIRLGVGHKNFDKILYPFLAALKTKKIKPDIAHANLESYAGIALALLKYFHPKAKRILTLQSGNLLDKNQKNKFFIKFFWRTINFSPDRLIAVSNFLKKRSINLGVPEKCIEIIPNGVDFSKVVKQKKPKKNLVFFAGRLSWEKGAEYMFKAWPQVLKKIPDARLLQVGGGDMKEKRTALIKK